MIPATSAERRSSRADASRRESGSCVGGLSTRQARRRNRKSRGVRAADAAVSAAARPQHSHGKTDQHQQRSAPRRPRREPTRRKQRANRAAQPTAFFLAIQNVFETRAATGQQRSIRLSAFSTPASASISFPASAQRRIRGQCGKMFVHVRDFGGDPVPGGRKENQPRLKFGGTPGSSSLPFLLPAFSQSSLIRH